MTALFFAHALLPDGWASDVRISIARGLIAAVERDAGPAPGDVVAGIAVPGMPNVHSHAFQRGMAGLSERRSSAADSFWSWREIMYSFLDRMTPEDVEAISAQAFVEMLQGGFTRVGEFHYLHNAPDGGRYDDPAELSVRIVAASLAAGIRLSLIPCFYAHGDFAAMPPVPGQRRFLNHLDGFASLFGRAETLLSGCDGATLCLAPHSLRAVAVDQLGPLLALAGHRPVHIHAAEQVREVEACLAWSGQRPVEWLLDHMPVDQRWCLIHATHMTGAESARLAATGAVIGLCPLTEASLGDGIFAGPVWRDAHGRFSVGTDSNIAIGVAEELRQLESAQRLATRQRNVMCGGLGASTGETLFRSALEGGARALAAPPPELAPGAPADLVGLDADAPCFASGDPSRFLDGWIFAGDRAAVRDVWVGGRRLVQEGRHRHADSVGRAYRRCVARLAAA